MSVNIHDKLNINHEWTTPIGKMHIYLPEITRQVLISIMTKQSMVFTEQTYDKKNKTAKELNKFNNSIYNLFDYSKDNLTSLELSALKEFEKISSKIIRTYINKAWEIDEDVEVKVRAFGNVQRPFSRRTSPHFHHGWDGVFVHYLTVGEEFNHPKFSDEKNEHLATTAERTKESREILDKADIQTSPEDYSGDLLLLDPRPAIRMPYNNKAKTIKPEVGLTLVHPAYLWHETQTHTKPGIRVAIVINFNINNRNYDELPTNLAFYRHEDPSVLP